MSKTLSQPVVQSEQVGNELNNSLEDELMVQQSMRALENQQMYEQDGNYDVSSYYDNFGDDITSTDVISNDASQTLGGKNVSNTFANLFHKLADVFGKDNVIGAKCEEWAVEIEKSMATDVEAEQIQQESVDSNDLSYDYDDNLPTVLEQQESRDISNQNMHDMAVDMTESDGFLKAAKDQPDKFTQLDNTMRNMMYTLSDNTMGTLAGVDDSPRRCDAVATTYMTMMQGLQEYNDTAVAEINTKYADDSKKREEAMFGLGKVMQHAVEPAMYNTAIDDSMYNFLSDEDKLTLNNMSFVGIDKTYSDVVSEHTPDKAKEDYDIYASAGLQDAFVVSQAKSNLSKNLDVDKSSLCRTRDYDSLKECSVGHNGKLDRVAQAEELFSDVLANDKAAKENSFTAGL